MERQTGHGVPLFLEESVTMTVQKKKNTIALTVWSQLVLCLYWTSKHDLFCILFWRPVCSMGHLFYPTYQHSGFLWWHVSVSLLRENLRARARTLQTRILLKQLHRFAMCLHGHKGGPLWAFCVCRRHLSKGMFRLLTHPQRDKQL